MQDNFNASAQLPACLPDVYYVLEERSREGRRWVEAPVETYAEVFARNEHLLTFSEGNWAHPDITRKAFRVLHDKNSLLRAIESIRADENSLFRQHNKIENYVVYTVPAGPRPLFSLDGVEEAVGRITAANDKVGRLIRESFAERFTGRSYVCRGAGCFADHVGNELNLREMAAILGDSAAAAVAGPKWEDIADQRYLKCDERDVKPLAKIIVDAIPDEKLPACLRWVEGQRYGHLHPYVMNNWAAFAAAGYDGFVATKGLPEGGGIPHLVTDRYLDLRLRRGPLSELVSEWTKRGDLSPVTRMEGMSDFGRRFAETACRLRGDMETDRAWSDSTALWVTPGGWREEVPALPGPQRFPALGC
jgi:hypothetical protein